MSKEAALILGAIAAGVNAIVALAGLGHFDDGLQWEDLILILGPVLAALGIRENVFSRETVQNMARLEPKQGTSYAGPQRVDPEHERKRRQ